MRGKLTPRKQAAVVCAPPVVEAVVEASADVELATRYNAALKKHMAAIVAGQEAAASVATAGVDGARLAACVAKPFEAALAAVGSINMNVEISVSVSASASASAGGAASASEASPAPSHD